MSMCATEEEIQCFCLKLRVKWCAECQRWVCRMAYRGHRCLPPEERLRWRAQRIILNMLCYRTYLLEKEQEKNENHSHRYPRRECEFEMITCSRIAREAQQ